MKSTTIHDNRNGGSAFKQKTRTRLNMMVVGLGQNNVWNVLDYGACDMEWKLCLCIHLRDRASAIGIETREHLLYVCINRTT